MKRGVGLFTAGLALIIIAFFIEVASLRFFSSDFPDLSKFEVKVACDNRHNVVVLNGVQIDIYLRHRNEEAVPNEAVTVITMRDSRKQFAVRNILAQEGDVRKSYMHDGERWTYLEDPYRHVHMIVEAAPPKYLDRYNALSDGKVHVERPAQDLTAYRNLLYNAGCTTHGPIG